MALALMRRHVAAGGTDIVIGAPSGAVSYLLEFTVLESFCS